MTNVRTDDSIATRDRDGHGTVVLLIRHAHTDAVGRVLTGRAAHVPLSTAGRAQADRLGRTLATLPLAAVYTSPLERAVETARGIARHQAVAVLEDAELHEVDFGEWTGRSFQELDHVEAWQAFNRHRAAAVIPRGEAPALVQERIIRAITRLAAANRGRTLAVVTHADVIRSAVLYIAGSSLDQWDRFEIGPASVTAVLLTADSFKLLYVNRRETEPLD
jgi:probable phosphoglycerate mutase